MSSVQAVTYMPNPPLRIERDYTVEGREMIIIEGVRYDADLLRAFGNPAPDALYAVRREEDRVWLTVIRNGDEARQFFDEVNGRGNPAPTEDESDGL